MGPDQCKEHHFIYDLEKQRYLCRYCDLLVADYWRTIQERAALEGE